jgi:hypothetical protein
MYYLFGSSLHKKKVDYILEMKAETILSLFLEENFPDSNFSLMPKCVDWDTFEKFKIYNIFWNNNAISNTTKSRKYLWDKLINLGAKFISRSEVIKKFKA